MPGSGRPARCSIPWTYAETGLEWSTPVSVPTARWRTAFRSGRGLRSRRVRAADAASVAQSSQISGNRMAF